MYAIRHIPSGNLLRVIIHHGGLEHEDEPELVLWHTGGKIIAVFEGLQEAQDVIDGVYWAGSHIYSGDSGWGNCSNYEPVLIGEI